MRIKLGYLGVAAAALTASAAADESALTDLDWAKSPPFEQMKAVYPPAAFKAARLGNVELECRATAKGALEGCTVAKEAPAGEGFGEAALKLTPTARLKARTLSGQPVAGRIVRFPVEFEPWDTPADWLRKPSPDQLLAVFPPRALRNGRSGEARIQCAVSVQGRLKDCQVLSESPAEEGFGSAALALAPQFVMKPPMKDGRPAQGATVSIPIRFMTIGPMAGPFQRVISNIAWEEGPSVEQVLAAYPGKARTARAGGTVVLDCLFADQGRVKSCHPEQENPKGYGFAKAARDLAPLFRAREVEVDGKPLKGAHVHIPITFAPEMLETAEPPVGKPRWAALPSADEAMSGYPPEARQAGTPGQVQLSCRVAAGGTMEACRVVSEEPAGQGFGEAGLSLSRSFRMTAWSDEGLPTIGGRVRIPVRYQLKASAPAAPAASPPAP